MLASIISLTACSNESTPPSESFGGNVATLIVPADESQPASAQTVQYAFSYNYDSHAMDFAINGLNVDGVSYQYAATGIPTTFTQYANGQLQRFTLPAISNQTGGASATNIDASVLTLRTFQPVDPSLYPNGGAKRQYNITYSVGSIFSAYTFDADAFYFGTTATTYIYNNEHKEFASEKPVYNVILDLKSNKATVSIYNPVFAAEMPPTMAGTVMVLENLDIIYNHNGYQIVGNNIEPKVKEGSVLTPMPAFVFNNFTFKVEAKNIRYAAVSFKVAGKYDATAILSSAFDRM